MVGEILFFLFIFLVAVFIWDFMNKMNKSIPPGPVGLPVVGNIPFLGKFPHKAFSKQTKNFGNIFTVYFGNYPIVVLNDYSAIREVFKRDVFQGRPDLFPLMARGQGDKIGIIFSEGKVWQEQRRFTMKTLRNFGYGKQSMENFITDEVNFLIEFLKDQVGQSIPFNRIFEVNILNCLWTIITGKRISANDPKSRNVLKTITEGFCETELTGLFYFLPWVAKLAPEWSGWNTYLNSIPPTKALMEELIANHKDTFSPDHLRDFTDAYINEIYNTTDPSSSFYKEKGFKSLAYCLMDLFLAGAETTSTTLAWAFIYLPSHPLVLGKLQEEIDRVVGNNRRPCLSDRPDMPYTEAVMTEILRISSIAPLGFFHSALEDTTLQNWKIPKGTIFMANLHHVHNDPTHWKDPEVFRPERFISPQERTFVKDEHFIAFGTGKRACLGEQLAMNEFFLFLTGLCQSFNFSFDPSQPKPTLEPKIGLTFNPYPYSLIVSNRN